MRTRIGRLWSRALVGAALVAATSSPLQAMNERLRTGLEQALAAPAGGPVQERPFSVVIRGGVSLGVYEAGVNWAILRILKDLRQADGAMVKPELYAAAGASAGAINGFVAGLVWCTDERDPATGEPTRRADTLDDNLLRETWLGIDINELLVGRDPADERPEDKAGFSRALLRATQDAVKDAIRTRDLRADCAPAFGVSLTRDRPIPYTKAGVSIAQQRLLLPMQIRAGEADGKLEVRHLEIPAPDFDTSDPEALRNRAFRSSVIYMDALGSLDFFESPIAVDRVFDAIKASSAFPVAFAPKKLSYCLFQSESVPRLVASTYTAASASGGTARVRGQPCPDDYGRVSSFFVDGGVFDNDPVELVRQLTTLRNGDGVAGVRYIKIDPNKRRPGRARFRFASVRYATGGDSLEISLLAPSPEKDRALQKQRTITVRQCHAGINPRPAHTDHTMRLLETAPNSQTFVGIIDTLYYDRDERMWRGVDSGIEVADGDRLIPFDNEETPLDCTPPTVDADRLTAYEQQRQETLAHLARNRAISIVETDPSGLSTQLGFVGGSVSSARGYRLYDEFMRNDWHDGVVEQEYKRSGRKAPGDRGNPDFLELYQPTRLTTLTGDFLASFAGFLDERFRKFDYYAGVYDAVYGVAELICLADDDPTNNTGAGLRNCRGELAEHVYLQLCAPGAATLEACRVAAPESNAIMHQLAVLESCGWDGLRPREHGGPGTGPGARAPACRLGTWGWTEALVEPLGANARLLSTRDASRWQSAGELVAVGLALHEAEFSTRLTGRDPFVRFIRNLARNEARFARGDRSRVLGRMLALNERPVPTWFYPLADSMVPRLMRFENEDRQIRDDIGLAPAGGSNLILPALAIGGLAAESIMAERTGWLPDQTSVPRYADRRWLAWITPAEMAVDARNGGMALYLNPAWRLESGQFEIDFRVAPYLRQRFADETVEFSEASALFTWRKTNPLLSSIGIGPTYTYTWQDTDMGRENSLGATLSLGLLADKLRLSYGVRSFSRDDFAGDDIFFHIGINDLPGLIYWGARGGGQ